MLDTEDFEPDLSRVDKLNLEAARFNFGMTRLRDVVEAARFKAETDDDFFSPEVEMSDKSLFSRLNHKESITFHLIKYLGKGPKLRSFGFFPVFRRTLSNKRGG